MSTPFYVPMWPPWGRFSVFPLTTKTQCSDFFPARGTKKIPLGTLCFPLWSHMFVQKYLKIVFLRTIQSYKFWVKMLKGGEWEQICANAKFKLMPSQRDCPILLRSLDSEQNVMRMV